MPKPVLSTATAKRHLRVEHELDDEDIARYTEAAVDRTLQEIGLAGCLGPQVASGGGQTIRLEYPAVSVAKVEFATACGQPWQTMAAENYELLGDPASSQWVAISDTVWQRGYSYRVTYEAGWEKLPAWFEIAALFLVAHYYENRGSVVVGQGVTPVELPHGFAHLCRPHRRILFA